MTGSLVVLNSGTLTAVGLTTAQTCAAIRAGITGFAESGFFFRTVELEEVIAATVPLRPKPTKGKAFGRLVAMATVALRECISDCPVDPSRLALLLGVRESYRRDQDGDWDEQMLTDAISRELNVTFHPSSRCNPDGNAASIRAIVEARSLLETGAVDGCVIGGVDSFLNELDIDRLEAAYRLNREGEDGMIPGEGAAFLLVTAEEFARGRPVLGRILGFGIADENPDTVLISDGHPTGRGLQQALTKASDDAGLPESAIDWRVSDLNGERYRTIDNLLAVSRFYRSPREIPDIWHPAECVGEIGAAIGALLITVSLTALENGYAPGDIAMCEASSDAGLRAACLVSGSRS